MYDVCVCVCIPALKRLGKLVRERERDREREIEIEIEREREKEKERVRLRVRSFSRGKEQRFDSSFSVPMIVETPSLPQNHNSPLARRNLGRF